MLTSPPKAMKRKSNGSNSNSPVTVRAKGTEEEEDHSEQTMHGNNHGGDHTSTKNKYPYSKKVKPAVSETRRKCNKIGWFDFSFNISFPTLLLLLSLLFMFFFVRILHAKSC